MKPFVRTCAVMSIGMLSLSACSSGEITSASKSQIQSKLESLLAKDNVTRVSCPHDLKVKGPTTETCTAFQKDGGKVPIFVYFGKNKKDKVELQYSIGFPTK